MVSATMPRILLCAEQPGAADDIHQALEQTGHTIDLHAVSASDPDDLPAYRLIILDGSQCEKETLRLCRRLRARVADSLIPILFVTGDQAPDVRLASFESGADTCLVRPFEPSELLAQTQAFLRIKHLHDRLGEKTAEVHRLNKRLQSAYQQISGELELAGHIQQSFLPASLPEVPWARFAVQYRPCGRVGGDFYDVFRLDEDHLGFYVADAMGHGVPASLLTMYLKQGVRAKEIFDQQYRLVPPGEVLARLNRDLIAQHLSENPFITMVYALLDGRDRTLRFARAGHPHPLYVPAEGDLQFWQVKGSLLGVFESDFPVQTHPLHAGDKVLLYTDGTEAVAFEGNRAGKESLLACATRHRALPIPEFLERLSWDLLRQADQPDDFTLLGLEMTK
jgi:sigma-B regulation protein RsbU (phosphoserine phosphatase)